MTQSHSKQNKPIQRQIQRHYVIGFYRPLKSPKLSQKIICIVTPVLIPHLLPHPPPFGPLCRDVPAQKEIPFLSSLLAPRSSSRVCFGRRGRVGLRLASLAHLSWWHLFDGGWIVGNREGRTSDLQTFKKRRIADVHIFWSRFHPENALALLEHVPGTSELSEARRVTFSLKDALHDDVLDGNGLNVRCWAVGAGVGAWDERSGFKHGGGLH